MWSSLHLNCMTHECNPDANMKRLNEIQQTGNKGTNSCFITPATTSRKHRQTTPQPKDQHCTDVYCGRALIGLQLQVASIIKTDVFNTRTKAVTSSNLFFVFNLQETLPEVKANIGNKIKPPATWEGSQVSPDQAPVGIFIRGMRSEVSFEIFTERWDNSKNREQEPTTDEPNRNKRATQKKLSHLLLSAEGDKSQRLCN